METAKNRSLVDVDMNFWFDRLAEAGVKCITDVYSGRGASSRSHPPGSKRRSPSLCGPRRRQCVEENGIACCAVVFLCRPFAFEW